MSFIILAYLLHILFLVFWSIFILFSFFPHAKKWENIIKSKFPNSDFILFLVPVYNYILAYDVQFLT